MLIDAIQRHDLATVEDLKQATLAGTGCGSCVPELAEMLARRVPTGQTAKNAALAIDAFPFEEVAAAPRANPG